MPRKETCLFWHLSHMKNIQSLFTELAEMWHKTEWLITSHTDGCLHDMQLTLSTYFSPVRREAFFPPTFLSTIALLSPCGGQQSSEGQITKTQLLKVRAGPRPRGFNMSIESIVREQKNTPDPLFLDRFPYKAPGQLTSDLIPLMNAWAIVEAAAIHRSTQGLNFSLLIVHSGCN